jgi:hypothetical protein
MNKWIRFMTPILAIALVAGFIAVRPVSAAAPSPEGMPSAQSVADALPAGLSPDAVLGAEEFAEVVDLTKLITPYIYVDATGMPRLQDVSAQQIGVSEEFLANFKMAMTYSNQLVARGTMKVAPDMTTTMVGATAPGRIGLDPRGPGTTGITPDAATDKGADPTWGGWDYNSGAMFYSSYGDWTYYRYNYYPLCNSMAAYIRRPYMSTSLCNFWGYNQNYFQNYCYSTYGTYYYMPYAYACQNNYGCNVGYKPAYFWTRSYYYQPSCGCYQYNWNWQQFNCRY